MLGSGTELTLFNTIFLRTFGVAILLLTSYALNTLVEVVLVGSALLGVRTI